MHDIVVALKQLFSIISLVPGLTVQLHPAHFEIAFNFYTRNVSRIDALGDLESRL